MAKVYIGLGSNIGDKRKHIDKAIELLSQHDAIQIIKISSFYETDPVGYTDQDVFLNAALEISTTLEPYELLAYCNHIEEALKRKRRMKWGPRTIDIDILLYEGYSSRDEKLTIPHAHMEERAFVIVPLSELSKDIVINGKNIEDIPKNMDISGVRKYIHKESR